MSVVLCEVALVVAVLTSPSHAGTAPAASVGCHGVECDNEGPKANGCFADRISVASGGDNSTRLYYSDACHAFWAWSNSGERYWSTFVHLEMEELVRVDSVTQEWQFRRRLIISKPSIQSSTAPEWTNALGARTNKFRFRALWVFEPGGSLIATPWARGGAR